MLTVAWHRLAAEELNEAAGFLESKRDGLGEAFLREAERSVAAIEGNPEAGHPIGPVVRRRILRRFPYAILYATVDRELRILAVMHMRRRPAYWEGRLVPEASDPR